MKTVILARHAKASQGDFRTVDFDRPLNDRGKQDANLMGQKIRERQILPDLIISSPAKRARKTAIRVARQLGYPEEKIQYEQKIYESNSRYLLDLLLAQDDRNETIMLFGHNPDLSDFVGVLLAQNGADVALPTMGVYCLEFAVNQWGDLKERQGKVVFFDYPKLYADH